MAKKSTDNTKKLPYVWATLRLLLGFTFLWAFADKMIGLGFSTCYDKTNDVVNIMCDKSFVMGGSPTEGFLNNATQGPLADFYKSMAGNVGVDWLFMVGLLGIGTALMLGVGMRVATVAGALLMTMMWSASLPPANNPILDEHIIYIVVLVGLYLSNKNQVWGFGKFWANKSFVKKYKWLE